VADPDWRIGSRCYLARVSGHGGHVHHPIASNRSGPHIILSAGRYHLTSTDGCVAGSICVWESATLTGLGSATRHAVWKIPACPAPNCGDIWAPEIHQIGGRFYIYYTFHLANRAGNQQCSSTT
jgi:GH43 family beta-xylosidase